MITIETLKALYRERQALDKAYKAQQLKLSTQIADGAKRLRQTMVTEAVAQAEIEGIRVGGKIRLINIDGTLNPYTAVEAKLVTNIGVWLPGDYAGRPDTPIGHVSAKGEPFVLVELDEGTTWPLELAHTA